MSMANVQYSNPAILPQHRTNNLPQSRSHLSLQITHPAAFASDPQNEAEYSPLEAPALPFSSSGSPRRSRTRSAESNGRQFGSTLPTRPTSSSSLPSLAVTSSTSWSPHTPSSDSTESLPSTSSSRRDMHGRGLSDAQEELLVEARSDRENGKDVNPYAWERPLDSINRHSRMLDSSPLTTASDPNGRRVSRLPPGVQMLDPFGFSLAADASPYDLALNASSPSATPGIVSPSRSPVRASFLQPQLTSTSTSTSSHGHSQFPSSSSIASNLSNASTAATSPTIQPWTKPRAASAGEVYQLNGRAQFKNGLLGPPQMQRGTSSRSRLSKLSGEIEAETASVTSTASKQQLPAFVPADSDYLNSKLYARTLKAQKALEKERVKAASKGKMSRYDSEAAKSTSSLTVPRSSMDTGRPASIFSVASAGKVRSGRRSGLGWFKSNSEVALSSPPTPDPPSPSPPLPTSRSSTAFPPGLNSNARAFQPESIPPTPEPVLRSTNSSSNYLREARESVAAQKAPPMSSRQTSASSSGSSGGEELARPAPIPIRKSRASPSGSFQHSPTIRETSPPTTPTDVDESSTTIRPPHLESAQSAVSSLPPPVVPVSSPTRPSRQASLDQQTRPSSTTPTLDTTSFSTQPPASHSSSSSGIPHRISSSTLKPSAPSPETVPPSPNHSNVTSGPPPTGPPVGRLPQPPPTMPQQPQFAQTAQPSFPPSSSARPQPDFNRSRQAPPSPSKSSATLKPSSPSKSRSTDRASVVPPPLLTPDASLANGAEVGVKRRKSSLGLLFGGGGSSSRNAKNAPSPTTPQVSSNRGDKERSGRRMEEKPRSESKPVVKEKMKEKVKESFFGRVKRPEIPAEPKPTPASRPRPPPVSTAPTPRPPAQQAPSSRLPPGAQAPVPPFSQYNSQPSSAPAFPSIENGNSVQHHSRAKASTDKATRAPDSSSSASTEFSTLSSSSSTLPPTPSSGRSSNGLSKSVNGAPAKSNGGGGGGSAFSNFFSRHRTKSLGTAAPNGAQKLSRSKNSTPTPEDDRKQMPVLPSKGNQFVERMSASKKPSRTGPPQSYPGIENYAIPPSNNPNDLMITPHRGYPAYA